MKHSQSSGSKLTLGLTLIFLLGCSSYANIPIPAPSPIAPTPKLPATSTATIAITTSMPLFAGTLKGDPDLFGSPQALAVDAQGNLYVVDGKYLQVKKLDPAGRFITQWGATDGKFDFFSSDTQTNGGCIAVDPQGNVYVDDMGNYRIEKFDANGKFILEWGNQGDGDGQFSDTTCVGSDSQGNVYVSDFTQHHIQKFDAHGNFLLEWGSQGNQEGQFNGNWAVAADPDGNIYVGDYYNNSIQKFDAHGKFLAKFDIPAIENIPVGPAGLACDLAGALYLTDVDNNRVIKLDRQGKVIAVWGSQGSSDSQFLAPWSVATDSQGNIYVADTANGRVQKFQQPDFRP